MFEVGMRVRRTSMPYDGVPVGTEAVVKSVNNYGEGQSTLIVKIDGSTSTHTWAHIYCEPVVEQNSTHNKSPLPTDSDARKTILLYSGLLAYFPAALAAVANVSFEGNEKHNPGKPLQHARNKSTDHPDCILRHLIDGMANDDTKELAAACWRNLALLQERLEAKGAPVAMAATFD